MTPKLIIFDMDGLILDSESVGFKAHQAVAQAWGMTFERAHYEPLIGTNIPGYTRIMTKQFPGLDIDAYRAAVLAQRKTQIEHTPIPLKPGVLALLDLLDELNIPKVICSSSARAVAEYELGRHGIWTRFAGGVFGDELIHSKPHPQIIHRALALTHCAPDDALVLEDSYNGIRAAISAGVPVIMIPDMLPPDPNLETLAVMEDLTAVGDWLRQKA